MAFNAWRAVRFFILGCAPMLVGATGFSASFDERVLAVHNLERASLGLPPLRWNPALAASAQGWADHLAATGSFYHAPERSSDPQGENLWAGTKGDFAVEARVDAWIREKQFFKPGIFPANSTTGNVEDVGHYTQLIWRDTRDLGCATAVGVTEEVLVCRYSSAGNFEGEPVY